MRGWGEPGGDTGDGVGMCAVVVREACSIKRGHLNRSGVS